MTVKYPHIELELVGHDGNAFAILGRFKGALRDGGVPKNEIDELMAEAMAGDYGHLLRTVMASVEVAESDDSDDDDPYCFDDDDEDDDWDEEFVEGGL